MWMWVLRGLLGIKRRRENGLGNTKGCRGTRRLVGATVTTTGAVEMEIQAEKRRAVAMARGRGRSVRGDGRLHRSAFAAEQR